ncbi:hypothetical protein B0H10DRAFT_2437730 [Mycena sp. CBHHK59/15]|nr:hypothetical protein B0H10DRAFT_2437730 [Mycena sp. CBHHK59/15]
MCAELRFHHRSRFIESRGRSLHPDCHVRRSFRFGRSEIHNVEAGGRPPSSGSISAAYSCRGCASLFWPLHSTPADVSWVPTRTADVYPLSWTLTSFRLRAPRVPLAVPRSPLLRPFDSLDIITSRLVIRLPPSDLSRAARADSCATCRNRSGDPRNFAASPCLRSARVELPDNVVDQLSPAIELVCSDSVALVSTSVALTRSLPPALAALDSPYLDVLCRTRTGLLIDPVLRVGVFFGAADVVGLRARASVFRAHLSAMPSAQPTYEHPSIITAPKPKPI